MTSAVDETPKKTSLLMVLTFCSEERGEKVYMGCQMVEHGCHLIEWSRREDSLGR